MDGQASTPRHQYTRGATPTTHRCRQLGGNWSTTVLRLTHTLVTQANSGGYQQNAVGPPSQRSAGDFSTRFSASGTHSSERTPMLRAFWVVNLIWEFGTLSAVGNTQENDKLCSIRRHFPPQDPGSHSITTRLSFTASLSQPPARTSSPQRLSSGGVGVVWPPPVLSSILVPEHFESRPTMPPCQLGTASKHASKDRGSFEEHSTTVPCPRADGNQVGLGHHLNIRAATTGVW